MQRPIAMVAMPTAAALLACLAFIWAPHAARSVPAAPVPPPPHPAATRQTVLAASAAASILARPVFAPGRRPPATAVQPTPPATLLPRLAGTLITPSRKLAIFAGPPHDIALQEGDLLAGMIIEHVADGRITLGAAGRHIGMAVTPHAASPGAFAAVQPADTTVMPRIAERSPDGQHEE